MLIPGEKLSPTAIEPVLLIEPWTFAAAWIPTALLTLLKPIDPSTETVLLLFRVMAAPLEVGLTDPPVAISIFAGPPLTAVAVLTGVEVDVEMVKVCACAAP